MAAKSIEGFHFESDVDGACAIEVDAPYEGAVTFTWKPSAEYAGSACEAVIPQSIFLGAVKSYIAEQSKKPAAQKH